MVGFQITSTLCSANMNWTSVSPHKEGTFDGLLIVLHGVFELRYLYELRVAAEPVTARLAL